jgi:hypothetical protein
MGGGTERTYPGTSSRKGVVPGQISKARGEVVKVLPPPVRWASGVVEAAILTRATESRCRRRIVLLTRSSEGRPRA